MKITSREYKLMLRPTEDVTAVWQDVATLVRSTGDLVLRKTQKVSFLDTAEHSLRENGYVLRRRFPSSGVQYTLKRRSPDIFIARGVKIKSKHDLRTKLEEDISFPFRSRFSYSGTIDLKKDVKRPEKLFSNLQGTEKLIPVNGVEVSEEVYEGVIVLDCIPVSAGVLLWKRDGKPLLGEFSFRYKSRNGKYPLTLALAAKSLYEDLQTLPTVDATGITKTQFVYEEPSWMQATMLQATACNWSMNGPSQGT